MAEEENNKAAINRSIDKSEDDFESKLTYITAGALGLSFAFIEKIVEIEQSTFTWILILGWILLCITLLINLISHLISKRIAYKNQDDLDELDGEDEQKVNAFNKKVKERNFYIELINYISVALLIIGITSIVLFTSINISQDNRIKTNSNNMDFFIDSSNVKIKFQGYFLQINDSILKIEKHGKDK